MLYAENSHHLSNRYLHFCTPEKSTNEALKARPSAEVVRMIISGEASDTVFRRELVITEAWRCVVRVRLGLENVVHVGYTNH